MSKAIILLLLVSGVVLAQQEAGGATPLESVELFKSMLDARNVAGMCEVMADPDTLRPLPRTQFERMQPSMEGLLSMWYNHSFSYGQVRTFSGNDHRSATVQVRISALKQNVTFSLVEFGSRWHINDIGISFY